MSGTHQRAELLEIEDAVAIEVVRVKLGRVLPHRDLKVLFIRAERVVGIVGTCAEDLRTAIVLVASRLGLLQLPTLLGGR